MADDARLNPMRRNAGNDQSRRLLLRPSWSDPRAIVRMTKYDVAAVTLSSDAVTLVAPADPDRVMIGFHTGNTIPVNLGLLPSGVPSTIPISDALGVGLLWFSLFDFGPLVCYEWSVINGNGLNLVIHQVTNR